MQDTYSAMRQDLVGHGFTELTTADDVVETMDKIEGTALIVVNSICGCAAGQARPAVREAVKATSHKPDHLFTVFAGQDKEATAKMRNASRKYHQVHRPSPFGKTVSWHTLLPEIKLKFHKRSKLKIV